MEKEDCVVILSGGLDSTVLLYHLIEIGKRPILITFDYGQKHQKEIQKSKATSKKLGLRQIIVSLPLGTIFHSSSLLSDEMDIPEGHYTDKTQRSTVVPNRNMIMLAIAAGIAEDNNISDVFYGAHKNDRAIYPDCRPEFIDAVSEATKMGTYNHVVIKAPFRSLTKADIVREGVRLNVPFEDTWSCYKGDERPCGKCGTCVERKEAFDMIGIKDPGG